MPSSLEVEGLSSVVVVLSSLEVEELSSVVVVVVPSSLEVEELSCPWEEGEEGVEEVSSPYLTPHANNESL